MGRRSTVGFASAAAPALPRAEKTGNDPCPTERKGSPAPLVVEAAMWALGRLFKMMRGGKRDRDFTWETILFSKERNASIIAILGNRREVAFSGGKPQLSGVF